MASHASILRRTGGSMEWSLGLVLVGRQLYKTDASQEYVILGNDAVLKCQYPSFVSEFLTVLGWADSEGEFYSVGPDSRHGIGLVIISAYLHSSCMIFILFPNFPFHFQLLTKPIELLFTKSLLSSEMMFSSNVTYRATSLTLSELQTGLIQKDQPSVVAKVLVI